MSHYIPVIYGHRCTSASEVYESDSVFHFRSFQNSLGSRLGGEIFAHCRDFHLGHYGVYLCQVAFLSYEYLEIAFKCVAGHSDNIILYDLKIFSVGERLCHGSVDGFLCRVVYRIERLCKPFEVGYVFRSDILIFASVRYGGIACLLPDGEFRHADDCLRDLDAELVFSLPYGFCQGHRHMRGIEDTAVAYACGRCLLVVYDLNVLPVHLCHGKCDLGRPQVYRNYVFLVCIHMFSPFICIRSDPCI